MLNVTANYDLGEKNSSITNYVTLLNTRRLIDSSYLVAGICTVQVKLNQSLSHSKKNLFFVLAFLAELQLSPLLFPCCRFFFLDSWPKCPQLSIFLSQCVHLAISQLVSSL